MYLHDSGFDNGLGGKEYWGSLYLGKTGNETFEKNQRYFGLPSSSNTSNNLSYEEY